MPFIDIKCGLASRALVGLTFKARRMFEMGHLRHGGVDHMSAIALIATDS